MIYVTGDIHGNPIRLSSDNFPEGKSLNKDDVVIICGDFGIPWNDIETREEKYLLDWLNDKPWTTVFVPGNHENYNVLYKLPTKVWNNGVVSELRPTVLCLNRGEIYKVNNKTLFCFGGAASHDIRDGILDPVKDKDKIKKWKYDYDKLFRIKNVSWWEQEMPSDEEMQYGMKKLMENSNKVDFIITHCCSSSTQAILSNGSFKPDSLTNYFEKIKQNVDYKKWFFGHYHGNKNVTDKDILIYEQIVRIV